MRSRTPCSTHLRWLQVRPSHDARPSAPGVAMGGRLLRVCLLVFIAVRESSGLKIRNKLLGKCLQVQGDTLGGTVSLGECNPHSPLQEWRWLPESQALSSLHTGECLTALGEQHEAVHLQPCIPSDGRSAVDVGSEASSQAWSCSRKGHLTLMAKGLILSATQQSTLILLSRENNQGSRWRTLDNKTLCNGRDGKHNQHQDHPQDSRGKSLEPGITTQRVHKEAEPFQHIMYPDSTESYPAKDVTLSSLSTKSPADPTMIFFSMDYGMGWKITMLVLSSLALVLGTVILILNVYANRRKKVVCVLKSYKPRPELSVPGSPAPSERAPLTEHAMCFPHSSPTLQRGEILIEWKDGTVTPLYEA